MKRVTAVLIVLALAVTAMAFPVEAEQEYVDATILNSIAYGDTVLDSAWSPDDQYLAIGGVLPSSGDEVQVYRLVSGSLFLMDSYDYGFSVDTVDWSPDGNYLAIGGSNPSSGNEVQVLRFDEPFLTMVASSNLFDDANDVDWSPDGRFLAVGCNPGASGEHIDIFQFDGSSLTLFDFYDHGDTIYGVDWSPDGNYLAIGGETGTGGFEVRVLFFTGASLMELPGSAYSHGIRIIDVAWSPDGNYLCIGGLTPGDSYQMRVLMFDGASVVEVVSYNFGMNIYSVAWDPSGGYIVVGHVGVGLQVNLLSFNGSTLTSLDAWVFSISSYVSWSNGGEYLALCGNNGAEDLTLRTVEYGAIPEDDSFTIVEDILTEIDVLANDVLTPGEFSITGWTNGTNCAVNISGSNLAVLPAENWTGVDSFTYNVTDAYARDFTRNADITVTNTNDMHMITTANTLDAVVDEHYSVDYNLTDVDPSDTHTWSVATNASWLWMEEDTGILSGWPDEEGIFVVHVTATDQNDNTVTTEFLVTVELDTDHDGTPDHSDNDWDEDGYNNNVDAFPYDNSEWNDTDMDGIGDNVDDDLDGDGVPNANDTFPMDGTEWMDTDNDTIGDNADLDDDNDTYNDAMELALGADPKDNTSIPADADHDGIPDAFEVVVLTDIGNKITDLEANLAILDTTLMAELASVNSSLYTEIQDTITAINAEMALTNESLGEELDALSTEIAGIETAQEANFTAMQTWLNLVEEHMQENFTRVGIDLLNLGYDMDNQSLSIDTRLDNITTLLTTLENQLETAESDIQAQIVSSEEPDDDTVFKALLAAVLVIGTLNLLVGFKRPPMSPIPGSEDDIPIPEPHDEVEGGEPSEEGTVSYAETQTPYDRLG